MGRNAGQFIAASTEFLKMGFKEQEQLQRLSVDAWMFGEVMGMTTAEAAKAMASLVVVTGASEDKLRSLITVAAELRQNFGASTEAIMGGARAMPAMAKELGIQTQQLMGLSAVFERMGMSSSEASGFVGDLVNKLADPRMRWQLQGAGMDTEKLLKSLQNTKGGADSMRAIAESTKGMSTWLLKSKFGFTEAQVNTVRQMQDRMAEGTDIMNAADDAYGKTTLLARLFGEATFNLKDQFEFLSESVGAFVTLVGSYLNPILAVILFVMRQVLRVINLIPTPLLAIGGVVIAVVAVMVASLMLAVTAVLTLALAYSRLGRAIRESIEDVKKSILWTNMHTWGTEKGIIMTLRASVADMRRIAVMLGLTSVEKALTVVHEYLVLARRKGIAVAWAQIKTDMASAVTTKTNALWTGILEAKNWMLAASHAFCNTVKSDGLRIALADLAMKIRGLIITALENSYVQRSIVLSTLLRSAKWALGIAGNFLNATKTKGILIATKELALDAWSVITQKSKVMWNYLVAGSTGVKTAAKTVYTVVSKGLNAVLKSELALTMYQWAADKLVAAGTYLKAGALGVYNAVLLAYGIVTGQVTVAQWALNIATYAFPLMWIVLGIMAVIGVFALLAKWLGGTKALMIALGIAAYIDRKSVV
jgi:hypothetical protein